MKPFLQKYDTDQGVRHIVDGIQQNVRESLCNKL